jgi:ABC-2 type transport system permease protein
MRPTLFNLIQSYVYVRWVIIKTSVVDAFFTDIAFVADNWSNILSSTLYTISTIFYIQILYTNTESLAGYSRNEMMIFFLFGQFSFYFNFFIFQEGLRELIRRINTGGLDLLLTKPLPALFFVTYQRIKLLSLIRDGIPPILMVLFVIDFHSLTITFWSVLAGLFVFCCGLWCLHVFQFLFAITAFWTAESTNLLGLSWVFEYNVGRVIPFEGFTNNLKFLCTTIIPVLIVCGLSSSVFLHKSSILPAILYTIIVTIILVSIKNIAWNFAIKNYTSASS